MVEHGQVRHNALVVWAGHGDDVFGIEQLRHRPSVLSIVECPSKIRSRLLVLLLPVCNCHGACKTKEQEWVKNIEHTELVTSVQLKRV